MIANSITETVLMITMFQPVRIPPSDSNGYAAILVAVASDPKPT